MLLGAQSYTVRDYTQTERDFAESMKRISAIGYKTVQLSATGAFPAEFSRRVCDENGLKIVLTHTNPEKILSDTESVIRDHDIMGCRYVGIGMMPPKYQTDEWIDRFAKDFITPAKRLRDAGKRLMYHNHNLEWTRLKDGRRIIDVLLDAFPEDLLGFTLDTYWVQAAGADIFDWIRILQDRIPCVHLKDMAVRGFEQRMAVVGEGNMNFPRILETLKQLKKTEYILVEQDNCYGESPFDCLQRSYKNITEMGFGHE